MFAVKVVGFVASLFLIYAGLMASAHASRLDSGAGVKFYLSADGKQINALEADKEATLDHKLFQCQPVEKVCNEKTGKCTIKAVK